MAVKLSKDNFEAEISAEGIVVADFYSDSCIPCKRMSPVIAELEEELAHLMHYENANEMFFDSRGMNHM